METQTGTYLPVEVKENESYDDSEIFDYRIHKSHLLNCKQRRNDWNEKKKHFVDLYNLELTLAMNKRDLLK